MDPLILNVIHRPEMVPEYPYLYNLIDQYHDLAKYNNGYAYNMMFVEPAG